MTLENIIHFINQHTETISITRLTALFGISRSTYYRNKNKDFSALTAIEKRIYQLVVKHHFLFGYRKIHALVNREMPIGINKVARIMKKYGWNCIAKVKKYSHVGKTHKKFENLIQKDWSTSGPMEKLTTDITYLPFGKSMLYLSTIMDTFNGEIIAYEVSEHPDTKLVIDTFNQLNNLKKNTILHSDQGTTYTSKQYCDLIKQKGVTQSMSRKGTPSDNAPIESFHASLKSETFYILKEPIGSNDRVIDIVEKYIYFWNNYRILAKLGYYSPIDYRLQATN